MNTLMAQYGRRGLEILGMPCAQFDNQEPGDNPEILNCLKYVRPGGDFVPSFPIFGKLNVNGGSASPLYKFLRSSCVQPNPEIGDTQYISWTPVMVDDITWNFEKFLIDKNGIPYKRYTPSTQPLTLSNDIEFLLSQ
eukprot:TRINITY_DN63072_c0_g1_i1.p1 TRINITY_DN63072_c0_g1~~TRINITY_DN63072_c0_g1_i1.p1  ORF type:complete len:137 (+),score=16.73 TRINITY_DN63072_c0_g1_i1:208-618(+)